jgi:hypothetical protein
MHTACQRSLRSMKLTIPNSTANTNSIGIYLTAERMLWLDKIEQTIHIIATTLDPQSQSTSVKYSLAYISEQRGRFDVALTSLSDLISVQSQNSGVSI